MSKPFTALVAAEIVGRKINLRVEFPTVPTIAELTKTAEHLFNGELAALRPDLVSKYSIKISKFKHYEESTQRWLELSGDLQYFDHKQMYAFQFPSPYYKETQQELPNPRIPVIPYDLMKRDLFLKGDSMSEKIRAIFHEMDSDGDGIVNFENMYNLFHQIGLNFSEATVKDLFNFGDRNRTGILSMVDFQVIGNRYPIMVDCLFYHSRHFCDNPQLRNELAQARETCEKAKESVNCIARSRDVSVKIVHAAQKNVSELDRELEDIRRSASNVSMYTQDIRKKSESMRMELLEVEGFIRNLQDQNSTHHMAHQKVHRAREVQFKKYHHSQLEVNRLNDLIVQLREQLRKAHEDLEQQQQIASDCQREMQLLQASEDHLNDLISDTSRSISESENHFSELKKTQERYNDQEKSFEVDFYSSQNKMNELLGKKSTLNATIDAENTELRRIETDYANALTFYQDAQLRSKELEKDLECILRTKQRVSGSERDLVEQEIRLKEQRSNLEERENALLRSASAIVTSVASGLSQ